MTKDITFNKKSLKDFEIFDKYEAGILLQGAEVKSVKLGDVNLKGSYLKITEKGEVIILGMHIAPYKNARQEGYDPQKTRKLLLNKKEIQRVHGKIKEKGLSLIPLKVYLKGSLIKLEIALAKSRKKYEKREVIKKREMERKLRKKEFRKL